MSVVVVGGDYLGSLEKKLYSIGVTDLQHITGRKALDRKVCVPKRTDLILVFTDYVNHCTAKTVKAIAKTRAIPLVHAKRSWTDVEEKLKNSNVLELN